MHDQYRGRRALCCGRLVGVSDGASAAAAAPLEASTPALPSGMAMNDALASSGPLSTSTLASACTGSVRSLEHSRHFLPLAWQPVEWSPIAVQGLALPTTAATWHLQEHALHEALQPGPHAPA